MTKKSSKTSPATLGSEQRDLDTMNHSLAEVKELSFEDTALQFKNSGGKWRISLRDLAEYYEVPFFQASRKITTNRELFRDLGLDAVTASTRSLPDVFIFKDGKLFDVNLSIRDSVSFLTTLNYKKYDGERKDRLIRLRNWLTDNAEKILTGEFALVTSPVLLNQMIEDRIESCRQVAAAVGTDLTLVLAPELALIEKQTGQSITYRNTLPRQNQYRRAPVFTETELGKQFNVTGTRVKLILRDKGYLKSIGSRLDFTSVGLLYGEWRPGIELKDKPRTMVRMRRFWNQDIVPKLEEHFYYIEKAKGGLFTGHLEVIS